MNTTVPQGDETGDGAPKAGRLRVQRGEPPLFLNKPFCLNYWASGAHWHDACTLQAV